MGESLMSKAKLAEFEKELEFLKTVKRKEMAEIIKEARSHGDLSENSEYDEAKNSQAIMEARIVEIERMLQNAKVIDEDELSTEHVAIGCTVSLLDVGEKEKVTYAIVSSSEADAFNNKISDESPVGAALMGHKKGDKVDILVPFSGETIHYQVLDIGKQSFN